MRLVVCKSKEMKKKIEKLNTGFELAIFESHFTYRLCLFANHFKQVFVKFANKNFPLVKIFICKETSKFLFTLQICQVSGYLKL